MGNRLSHISTEELESELNRRRDNPGWWFREAIAEGHGEHMESEGFERATDWMDDRAAIYREMYADE